MKSKGAWWPIAMGGVLAVTVGANGFLLFKATTEGGIPLESDYYQKAVSWDSTMIQATRNRALGWHVKATLDPQGVLSVELTDRAGAPLSGAEVSVEGFAVAFADGAFAAGLSPDGIRYQAQVTLKHAGLHELRFRIARGSDRFTAVVRGAPGAEWSMKS